MKQISEFNYPKYIGIYIVITLSVRLTDKVGKLFSIHMEMFIRPKRPIIKLIILKLPTFQIENRWAVTFNFISYSI